MICNFRFPILGFCGLASYGPQYQVCLALAQIRAEPVLSALDLPRRRTIAESLLCPGLNSVRLPTRLKRAPPAHQLTSIAIYKSICLEAP